MSQIANHNGREFEVKDGKLCLIGNDMEIKCSNCKHFNTESVKVVNDENFEEINTIFHVCNKMYIKESDAAMEDMNTLVNSGVRAACVISSGSGYEKFLVEHDFFCALFTSK
jgi:hypothetical protein